MEVGSKDEQRSRRTVTLMYIWQCLRVFDGDDLDIKSAAVARAWYPFPLRGPMFRFVVLFVLASRGAGGRM